MEKKNVFRRIGGFMKRNIYYFILFICIAAVGTMITLTVISKSNDDSDFIVPGDNGDVVKPGTDDKQPDDGNKDGDKDGEKQTSGEAVVFSAPVSGGSIVQGYSDTVLVFSSTLKQWNVHLGVDYAAEAGSDVTAAYDGVVYSVTEDLLNGTVITIDHGNGLRTSYGGVDPTGVKVVSGQSVSAGDVIALMGNSALNEYGMGAHLHFEILENGRQVNPMNYLGEDNK